MSKFKTIPHTADFCVVGGGLAGLCAAVAAARKGIKVVLVQDRPMLGGNASSEVRMWVCGAHGSNNRETGIVEELMLENYYRNPYKNYSIWDSILYEKAKFEPNITLLLNCSCQDGVMEQNRLKSITCWQLTTQTFHKIEANLFADCSGDSILAPITGALYRMGREARTEYNESIAPQQADSKTMGMSCLIQAREYPCAREYIAPKWAEHFKKEDLPFRAPNLKNDGENFWYLELGGEQNTIEDTEKLRDELLKVAYGMWDYVKNSPENAQQNQNYDIDWVGILPGKRESRRYIGDYIMTQNDVEAEGRFDDLVAYGGWSMDDHHPGGFRTKERPTIFHPAPSPYGIPYRSMYSKNVDNLLFAGRNISVTHSAMSSTRVMATCGIIGQAVGTAAAIAAKNKISPRDVYTNYMNELKQTLMEDDCYLPFNKREMTLPTKKAQLISDQKDAEKLRNGLDRPIGDEDNGWYGKKGSYVEYRFDTPQPIQKIRLVFDSDLNRETLPEKDYKLNRNMWSNLHMDYEKSCVPKTLVKSFAIQLVLENNKTVTLVEETNNYQRLYTAAVNMPVTAVRFIPKETWGSPDFHLFAFDLL